MTDLDTQMRQVLAELELTSTARTQAWNPSGSPSGEPDDRFVAEVALQPKTVTHPDQPPHLRYRALWADADGDERRRRLLRAAQNELDAIRGHDGRRQRVKPKAETEILEDRVLEIGEWLDTEVARHLGCLPRQVREIRAENSRDPITGRRIPKVPAVPLPTGRAARAQALAEQGLTQEQIAERMGVSQPTVCRLLKARSIRRDAA